jgi:hypothetical protein
MSKMLYFPSYFEAKVTLLGEESDDDGKVTFLTNS